MMHPPLPGSPGAKSFTRQLLPSQLPASHLQLQRLLGLYGSRSLSFNLIPLASWVGNDVDQRLYYSLEPGTHDYRALNTRLIL